MSFRILSTASRTAATSAISRLSTRSSPLSNASSLLPSCTSHIHHNNTKNTILMRHIVSSTPHLFSSTTDDKPDTKTTDDDDDECPPWQNPLHHNNPDHVRTLAEEFSPGEEMPLAPLPPFEMSDGTDGSGTGSTILAPPHLHDIADEIVRLNMLEVKELMDRIGTHFGFNDDDDDNGGGSGAEEGGDGGEGEGAEAVVEQTAFDLKLMGFDAKTKIKVIKEIRAMTSLGLKEAKELVEGAPTTIKKGIKKEEAEELKAKLVELGATIDIV